MDGDAAFFGVDEYRPVEQLEPGYVARAVNARFRNGVIAPRGGIRILPWLGSDPTTQLEDVRGGGVVSLERGQELLLLVTRQKVYYVAPQNVAVEITIPAGVTFEADVDVVQGNGEVFLGRGFEEAPLRLRDIGSGFTLVNDMNSQAGNGTGTLTIPNFQFGLSVKNRLVLAGPEDEGYISDTLNATRYSLNNAFRVNKGERDDLVRFVELNFDTIIAFKRRSVFRISNLTPDQNGDWSSAVLTQITDAHGLAAPRAIAQVGGDEGNADLYYLSDRGVTSIRLNEEGTYAAVDLPLSRPMERTMRRINRKYIDRATMAYHDNKLFLAVPLDAARVDSLTGPGSPASTYDTGAGTYDPVTDETYKTTTVSGLTAGRRYKVSINPFYVANAVFLQNGSDKYYGPTIFTAAGTSVTLAGVSDTPVAHSVTEVLYEGVNTAVLVYDFETRTWQGSDEGNACLVKRWLPFTWNGVRRLGFLSEDGYLRLYPDGGQPTMALEDEFVGTQSPYVSVIVQARPSEAGGDGIQVNGGASVAADNDDTENGATTWAATTRALAQANLWSNSDFGYDPSAGTPWSAPNTLPVQIPGGVRFVATNGGLPGMVLAGDWAVTVEGAASFITRFAGAPDMTVETRGYTGRLPGEKRLGLAEFSFETWAPNMFLTVLRDGVLETEALTGLGGASPGRDTYAWAGIADYDTTNTNDDHGTAGRRDYSVSLLYTNEFYLKSGVQFERMQASLVRRRFRGKCRYFQLQIRNAFLGRAIVRQIQCEMRPGGRNLTRKV